MARRRRVVLPNHPHHIVQRGHNRGEVFSNSGTRAVYLRTLGELKLELKCRVYAFALMTNHVHLILDPGEDTSLISAFMRRLSGMHAMRVNKMQARSGALWEGRFKSSVVDTEGYLLACCRYIDLNPVRAGLVSSPERYPWSSCRHKLGLERVEWLEDDPAYKALGRSSKGRQRIYRDYIGQGIPEIERKMIGEAIQRETLTGSKTFVEKVFRETGLRLEVRGPGRPRTRPEKGTVPNKNGDSPLFATYHEA